MRLLRRTHWPLTCVYCEEPVGVDEPVYVIDGEGKAVAANAAELHAEPYRYRSRVLHRSCAEDAGFAAPGLNDPHAVRCPSCGKWCDPSDQTMQDRRATGPQHGLRAPPARVWDHGNAALR